MNAMIEPLESRIAPAAVLHFTDSSGDLVTVKASKGTNADLAAAVTLDGLGNILSITLSSAIYEGSNFSIAAKIGPGGHGNGHVVVPVLNATGTDLGVVSIDGDVAGGIIGSNKMGTLAVRTFSALSIGESNSTLGSLTFDGAVRTFSTGTDVGPLGEVIFMGSTSGRNLVGSVNIRGAVVGGTVANGGLIIVEGNAGTISVTGALIGGTAASAGAIDLAASTLPSKVSVGSLLGNVGALSGSIEATGPLGAVTVAKNVTAGAGSLSGSIVSTGNIASVTVGDSITGNSAALSEIAAGADLVTGALAAPGNLGAVTVSGSIGLGGAYTVEADGNIGALAVGQDLDNTLIASAGNTRSVSVGGDLLISGIFAHGTGVGLALGSLTVDGSVHTGTIEAGHIAVIGQTLAIDATIGAVTIGGEVNQLILDAGTDAGVSSRIQSVTIDGTASNVDVASSLIARLVVDGARAPLKPGPNNDQGTFAGVTFDEI